MLSYPIKYNVLLTERQIRALLKFIDIGLDSDMLDGLSKDETDIGRIILAKQQLQQAIGIEEK